MYNTLMEHKPSRRFVVSHALDGSVGATSKEQAAGQQLDAPAGESPYALPTDPTIVRDQTGSYINWTATEFIDHKKGASWYLALAIVGVLLTGGVYVVTHDTLTTVVVAVAIAAFAYMGARKPRSLNYQIDDRGITIGEKFYDYTAFKSFSLVEQGPNSSIYFVPMKRFSPSLNIYFKYAIESEVVALLSEHLPFELRQAPLIDRLMYRLRF